MKDSLTHVHEQQAAQAFSRQSLVFDQIYGADPIIAYKRRRVRELVLSYLPGHASIIELNSGTGEDALFFASQGHRVYATDISEGMQKQLGEKVAAAGLGHLVTPELRSFHDLDELPARGPYDLLFSNFGGLNCTNRIGEVLQDAKELVKPGGLVALVIIPPFCLLEFLLLLKGEWRTATRRLFSRGGSIARLEGTSFRCWYHTPRQVRRHLQPEFSLVALEGLCTFVPPSYREGFAQKRPRLYRFLQRVEERLKGRWPWKLVGDYFIIILKKAP
ncbi:MAG: class SAM-dependent methyltransferase [Flaviaesturariibacter sp.]|nr:class SAM-dependent methyltransferase [Flaviaesturariibacter sp.]